MMKQNELKRILSEVEAGLVLVIGFTSLAGILYMLADVTSR